MKNEWKKLWLYIAALLVLIISAITSFSKEKRSYGNATEIKDSIKTILPSDSLNVYLTNEMSDSPDMEGFDKKVNNFMSVWQLRGVSLSVFRNDSLLVSKGYGMADKENHIEMSPRNILRIASVSKLITATGIMRLIEQKKLSLKDTVFGARGILNDEEYNNSIQDFQYYNITVEHLLRHQGGFSKRLGDPMFSTLRIIRQNGLDTIPTQNTLLKYILKRRLDFRPGHSQSYSNFGYFLLSIIIEKISGLPYEEYIQKYVLRPAGCYDFHIANNYYAGKYPNEVRYYVQLNEPLVPEYNNSGKYVLKCYGGNDIQSLSGAGAWVASSAEIAKFVASIDGQDGVKDIISYDTIEEMTQYFDDATYALGWNDTRPNIGWVRTGTFSGTTALIKYYPDGECWIFISNTSTWKGSTFTRYTSGLFRRLRAEYSSKLPKQNLFKMN